MTTYATRSPLQALHNPHMMSGLRRSSRRTSANLSNQEDAPATNGVGKETERSQRSDAGVNLKSVNGSSRIAGGRGKRKLEDEEDGDFAFTRTRSKKSKVDSVKQPEPIEEEPENVNPANVKKPKKKPSQSPVNAALEYEPKEKRRRSPRNSGEQIATEPPVIKVKKRRPKVTKSADSEGIEAQASKGGTILQDPEKKKHVDPVERTFDATKIALPFADTPIIRRNKEMRKGVENGHRRSSLGNRGRRASSLIDSGKSNALPHDEVESTEFYKHIESGLPEPRRMRQLLIWCGTRALAEKPSSTSEDYQARFSAREIQQQLLKDFSAKSELSDWFSRRDSTPPPQTPKPNPKNIANLAKIQDLEQQIAHLQSERQTWENLLRPASKIPSIPPSPNLSSAIQSSPSQVAALVNLNSGSQSLCASTSSRLQQITQNLEFEIDKFADNVHTLGSYFDSAGNVADRVLALSAEALQERSKSAEERSGGEVSMRNVLRGLSRVIDR